MVKQAKITNKATGDKQVKGTAEIIILLKHPVEVSLEQPKLLSSKDVDVDGINTVLKDLNVIMLPLFDKQQTGDKRITRHETLDRYFYVKSDALDLEAYAARFRKEDIVEACYVKPSGERPFWGERLRPLPARPLGQTPSFIDRQVYLGPAPSGIDASFAWNIPGGRGTGVKIIDLEWNWRFCHEDLAQNQGGVLSGVGAGDTNHGTAVIGVISADANSLGVTGISPEAHISAVAFSLPTAKAIFLAANVLQPGDVILLEIHRPGPRYNFQSRPDQLGYIPIEWWPDDYEAIRYATSRGIIVVEAAGNGSQNLDDPLYDQKPKDFPKEWSNPLKRHNRDCGAILVGAGAPPPGVNGSAGYGPDRSRLDFSNFGSAIDAQGWGRDVTTCGYGDLQGGPDEDKWYTDRFAGTSSASPIVVGALACIQGIRRARKMDILTPMAARALLRSTGSPQVDGPNGSCSQRIGNRPNLREMIDSIM